MNDDLTVGFVHIGEEVFLRTETRLLAIESIQEVSKEADDDSLTVLIYLDLRDRPIKFHGLEAEKIWELLSEDSFRHD